MRKWAADNADGLHAYVRTYYNPYFRGFEVRDTIVYADSLAGAKLHHGHTRERFASIKIRRALPEDLPAAPVGGLGS